MTEPPVASSVLKFEAIAEACRPMAVLLLTPSTGPDPSASEIAAARAQLAAARNGPGRIGWAVRIVLEGEIVGSRMAQAIDIVVRAAGYCTSTGEHNGVKVIAYRNVLRELWQPRSRRGNRSNQPAVSGLI